ncbi:MAG: HAD-IIA family hydrolase [Sedimenticolaceae bacterium]|nr:HAD-IIA family hydrolase [Sedimenticolaceae bacterium]
MKHYFLIDMDGILYHGDSVLEGATRFVSRIPRSRRLFVTNNPIRSPENVALKLSQMGFADIDESQVLTSAEATASWLAQQKPGFRYYAVGAGGLHEALAREGTEDTLAPDYVVVGEGPGIDFDSLTTGINLVIGSGAQLVSTNPDATVDATRNGQHIVVPGGGALVAPFEVATGRKAVVIGKPQALLYEMAMQRLGAEPADCIMVGDRPDTDILGAQHLGMRTALVRTGRFPPGEPLPDGMAKPDWDVDTLTELEALLKNSI